MSASEEKKTKQYFLAVIPPAPLYDEALKLKHYFKEHYNSKASLNSPPHITLHMPFQWKETKEEELIQTLEKFDSPVEQFVLALSNFGAFPPRVIFIDVAPNPNLGELQKSIQRFCKRELNLFNADYKDQPFHPHLTLAFRDLRKNMFAQAWGEFSSRSFQGSFIVDKFVLLKHNGHEWLPFKELKLQPGHSE